MGFRASVGMLLLFASLPGCSADPNQLQPVSGFIRLKEEPLEQGTIGFFTTDSGHRVSGGMINGGKYEIAAEFGLKPGTYRVEISSPETPAGKVDMIGGLPINRERIPEDYNTKSKLTFEVKSAGANVFDVAIP